MSNFCNSSCNNCDPWPIVPTPKIFNFLSSRGYDSSISPNNYITFSNNSSTSGSNISHEVGSSEFILAGNQIYQVNFSVNGIANSAIQGMTFALSTNNFITDIRVVSQNVSQNDQYNSGSASGFITTKSGSTTILRIINLGLDTIDYVNATISILQISDN